MSGRGRPDLKLQRAEVHLHELKQAIDSYRYGGDFHAEITPDAVSGDVEVTLRVTIAPALDEWSLLFGDCVHNVRAALDHLAWQLDSAPDKSTTFPTFTAKPPWWPPAAVARMSPPARTIIEAVQPYHELAAGRNVDLHPLAVVHALDISDKHNVLTVTLGRLAGDITGGLPFGASVESGLWQAFVDGAAISRIRLPNGHSMAGLTCVPSFDAVLVDVPLS